MQVKYLIIGAGPTGLGAALRLKELGEQNFIVLEANDYAGGLSASFKDGNGFTWDIGGHVLFSHYPYFDEILDDVMGSDFFQHRRIARIRSFNTWVPYPFQNNSSIVTVISGIIVFIFKIIHAFCSKSFKRL